MFHFLEAGVSIQIIWNPAEDCLFLLINVLTQSLIISIWSPAHLFNTLYFNTPFIIAKIVPAFAIFHLVPTSL